jgi:hypothetical protein
MLASLTFAELARSSIWTHIAVDIPKEIMGLDYSRLFTIDPSQEYAPVAATRGDDDMQCAASPDV